MWDFVGKIISVLLSIIILPAGLALAGEVNLSVAASLKDVINELSDNFARQNADIRILKNYGGSGALAKQIENGAPADIFISANFEWMEYLQNRKMMYSASIGIFTYNTLVFVGTADKKVSGLQDLPCWRRSPSAARRVFLPENTPWRH